MNNRSIIITLIVALSVICVSLIVGMIILMKKDINFNFGFNLGSWKQKLVDSIEEEGTMIDKIEFKLYSTDVEIKKSDTDNLKIEYYSAKEEDKFIKKENNTISVNEEESKVICIGICNNRRKVVVYVPSNYSGLYDIKTASGDITSEIDILESKININTTSGDINLKNISSANIYTTSGSIKVNDISDANIVSTSGDVYIKGETNKIDIKTTSGDIEINKVNKYLNLLAISGSVKINTLNIIDNSSISTTSGDVFVRNNISDCYVEYSTVTGDRNINKSDRKSDIVLKVSTISGDITVN